MSVRDRARSGGRRSTRPPADERVARFDTRTCAGRSPPSSTPWPKPMPTGDSAAIRRAAQIRIPLCLARAATFRHEPGFQAAHARSVLNLRGAAMPDVLAISGELRRVCQTRSPACALFQRRTHGSKSHLHGHDSPEQAAVSEIWVASALQKGVEFARAIQGRRPHLRVPQPAMRVAEVLNYRTSHCNLTRAVRQRLLYHWVTDYLLCHLVHRTPSEVAVVR